ncbi:MAG: VWA domain-containing protein, partial [bacterium]|nr:VWA domain-containing protein [bacterium]
GLITFDQKIRKYLPPRSIRSYLPQILRELDQVTCSEITDIANTLHEMAERIHRRGLIVIFSDLYDDPEKVMSGLKHFRHNKHEVIVFHILDPMEINFDFKRNTLFKDLETSDELLTQPWHIQAEYQNKVKQFIENYKRRTR